MRSLWKRDMKYLQQRSIVKIIIIKQYFWYCMFATCRRDIYLNFLIELDVIM